MGKVVLFLFLAFVAYLVIKAAARRNRQPPTAAKEAEPMVTCRRCGVNLPRSEAIEQGGNFYCSEEHRRNGEG